MVDEPGAGHRPKRRPTPLPGLRPSASRSCLAFGADRRLVDLRRGGVTTLDDKAPESAELVAVDARGRAIAVGARRGNLGGGDSNQRTLGVGAVVREGLEPGVDSGLALARARRRLLGKDQPTVVGRYRIIERLGRGGMGVVYRAHDSALDRDVALKLLPRRTVQDADARLRFAREAEAIAQLAHPNIVQVFEVGQLRDAPFFAMELIRGPSLRDWLLEQRTTAELCDVFRQAAEGLMFAHNAGVVHRDFKPDNVVVGDEGRARVVDFGLAFLGESETTDRQVATSVPGITTPRLTQTGTVMGTPAYMSPEQHTGHAASSLSDQFSFCVALYEALFGVAPFARRPHAQMLANILEGKISPPVVKRKIGRPLRRAITRGLRSDPLKRSPDMTALITALQRPRRRSFVWLGAGAS